MKTSCEGDTWGMTLDEFVAHLRSEDPKMMVDDERAADEIERLTLKLDALTKERDEWRRTAANYKADLANEDKKLDSANARYMHFQTKCDALETRLDSYQATLKYIANNPATDPVSLSLASIAKRGLSGKAQDVEKQRPDIKGTYSKDEGLRFQDGRASDRNEPCPEFQPGASDIYCLNCGVEAIKHD